MMTGRLTVVESLYWQLPDSQPMEALSRYQRILTTDEQPLPGRVYKATEEWQTIDSLWLKACSMLVIKNLEGGARETLPTPEEKELIAKRVLEVKLSSVDAGKMLVSPGESVRISPEDLNTVVVRCNSEAKYSLYVFPI